jgi:hypothetical protein
MILKLLYEQLVWYLDIFEEIEDASADAPFN